MTVSSCPGTSKNVRNGTTYTQTNLTPATGLTTAIAPNSITNSYLSSPCTANSIHNNVSPTVKIIKMPKLKKQSGQLADTFTITKVWIEILEDDNIGTYLVSEGVANYIEKLENDLLTTRKLLADKINT